MTPTIYLIRQAPDSDLYLDGYYGAEHDWAEARDRAWPFTLEQAKRILALVHLDYPNAVIVER